MRVTDVLAPLTPEQFLGEVYGQRAVLLGEPSDRFAHLLTWDQLQFALIHRRVEGQRVRLLHEGGEVPAAHYTRAQPTARGGVVHTIRPDAVAELLRKGATLSMDDVDEFAEPVADLVRDVERMLRETIGVTAYLSGGSTPGFTVHWDPHDAFAVQLVGRKTWRLYGPTQPAPLVHDLTVARPEGGPQEVYELRAGQVLYLPRGWWHGVEATGEPTLHLTIGVGRRTGVDLVAWLADELCRHVEFRRDLPRLRPDRYEDHMAALKRVLDERWTAELLRRFLAEDDARAGVRRRLALPDALPDQDRPWAAGDTVSLLAPRAVLGRGTEGEVVLAMDGQRWVFEAACAPAIALLLDGREHTVSELAGRSGPEAAHTVDAALRRLLSAGLVQVVRGGGREAVLEPGVAELVGRTDDA